MAARSVMFQYSSSHTLIFCFSFPGSDIRIWIQVCDGQAVRTNAVLSNEMIQT